MSEKQCKNCQYFLQHYSLDKHKIFRVHCGHCTYARTTKKKPDAKACEHYIYAPAPEDAFASKKYLSKELLQYVLNLELLPEIEERG